MKMELVRLGNSRGIRIPKPIIEQCGFGETVEVRVERDCLVIAPDRRPREGWEKAFQAAKLEGKEELLLEGAAENIFDREDWQW